MSYRTARRRLNQAMAEHDWLEGLSVVVGLVFLALAALCAWGIVTAIVSWGDVDPTIDGRSTTVGFLKVTRGFGVLLFALFGFVALGVGWFLAGDRIRRLFRRRSA